MLWQIELFRIPDFMFQQIGLIIDRKFAFFVIFLGIIILTIILLFSPGGIVRIFAGIPFVFILPGYLFLHLLWPSNEDLDQLRRTALVIPTSVAVVGILLLIVNYFFSYQFEIIVILIATFEFVLTILALLRSSYLSSLRSEVSWFRDLLEHFKSNLLPSEFIILFISILILGASITYAFITPRQQRELTEFYLVDPSRFLENQPYLLEQGEPLRVDAVVHSLESELHEYRIEVWADNSPAGSERHIIHRSESFSLDEGEEIKNSVSWFMPRVGKNQSAEILLYIDNEPEPYRSLLIWMDVTK